MYEIFRKSVTMRGQTKYINSCFLHRIDKSLMKKSVVEMKWLSNIFELSLFSHSVHLHVAVSTCACIG